MPLDTVMRVERAAPAQIETAGSRRTMQYRGVSLPLVTLADAAQVQQIGETRDLAVIVSSVHGSEVGLLGAMPVDVIETKAKIDTTTHRQRGIAGSAIIRDKTTLLADVYELVNAVYPEWAEERPIQPAPTDAGNGDAPAADPRRSNGGMTILLAEDSDFFRNQVKRYLEEEGFTVLDAQDGEAAWELLVQHAGAVRAVVTDIEMPRLNGLDLTRRIRADERTKALPVIAVTSLAGDEEVARGNAAGVSAYHIKLDRDKLIESLRAFTAQAAA